MSFSKSVTKEDGTTKVVVAETEDELNQAVENVKNESSAKQIDINEPVEVGHDMVLNHEDGSQTMGTGEEFNNAQGLRGTSTNNGIDGTEDVAENGENNTGIAPAPRADNPTITTDTNANGTEGKPADNNLQGGSAANVPSETGDLAGGSAANTPRSTGTVEGGAAASVPGESTPGSTDKTPSDKGTRS